MSASATQGDHNKPSNHTCVKSRSRDYDSLQQWRML